MLRKTMLLTVTLLLFVTISPQLFAEIAAENNIRTGFVLRPDKPVVTKPYQTPASTLHRIIQRSGLYDHLSNHPKFIKMQEFAFRVWEKQTRKKRYVSHARHRLPLHQIE